MALFTLTDDTVINTDYVIMVWSIRRDKSSGNYYWYYYITLHGYKDRIWQQFDMEETAKANRSQLLSMMANK